MEVYPGIHQLSVPIPNNPLGEVNAYLVKSKGECLLIDTGWNTDEAFGSLARQLSEADVAFNDDVVMGRHHSIARLESSPRHGRLSQPIIASNKMEAMLHG